MAKIAVGSTNPVKIEAVKDVFSSVLGGDINVVGLSVPSGVPDQPIGDETLVGAINRAKLAKEKEQADYGVGIEGGIAKFHTKWYSFGITAIYDGKHISTGISGWYELPEWVIDEINKGKELGHVMDELLNEKVVKRRFGAVAVFTNNLVDRKELYMHGIKIALGSLLKRELYGD